MRLRSALVGVAVLAVMLSGSRLYAQTPTGERVLGQSTIEPAYDDTTGNVMYLLTPNKAPFPSKANAHAVSPLYLIVYPHSAADSVGVMDCMHEGGDNCPDHGPLYSDLAMQMVPSVYGNGVWGHDHIADAPGGSEFNVAWQVFVVLFTDADAANTHITTEDQLDAAIDAGQVMVLPDVTFNCNVVSARPYWLGTPVEPVF